MSNSVLTFVIVGHNDHPIFESDLAPKPDGREVSCLLEAQIKTPFFQAEHSDLFADSRSVLASVRIACRS